MKGRTRRRSPPRRPPDIRCRRCARPRERILPRTTWTDRGPRSTGSPRREPASREPGCLPPPRFVLRRRDCSRPRCEERPPAHAAQHVLHRLWRGASLGVASAALRSPAMRNVRECEHLFDLLDCSCPGLTTQARQQARTARPSAGTDCPARYPRRPQCPDGFYDREFVARCAANLMSGLCPMPSNRSTKKFGLNHFFYPHGYPQLSTGPIA